MNHPIPKICPRVFAFFLLFSCVLATLPTNAHAQSQTQALRILMARADSLIQLGEYKQAEKLYKEALKIDPKSIEGARGLSKVAAEKIDWDEVKKWNKKIVQVNQNDVEANYYLGVAYRETGKVSGFIFKKKDFQKSEQHFNAVIERDPNFEDIFYQRALLERWKENWEEAIGWNQKQLDRKPQLAQAQVGHFKFYRLFLIHEDENKVLKHLQDEESDWAVYFLGEWHRRNGHYAQADSIFQTLLQKKLTISKEPILLSLVRLSLQQNQDEEAERYYEQATASINSDIDAQFIFEELKYIFNDQEVNSYKDLTSTSEKKDFFGEFWIKRKPTAVSDFNERILEHFNRLVYAEASYWCDGVRTWFNNPDKLRYLKFPKSYFLNEEFNDQGLIYIRHGEPTLTSISGQRQSFSDRATWYYPANESRPELILFFVVDVRAVGSNWRLSPIVDSDALVDFAGINNNIDRLLLASSSTEFISYQNRMADFSRENVFIALNTDTSQWE